MDLAEAVQLFGEHGTQARRLSALTVRAYAGDLSAFTEWRRAQGLSLDVRDVQSAEVEDYMASCGGVSPATIRRRLDALSSLYKYLVKRRLADTNPVGEVDRPRCPDRHRAYLTEAHMAGLVEVVRDTQERAILSSLCLLGLRRSEVVNLDCGDVNLAAGTLHIRQSKGGRSRLLPVPDDLAPALDDHLTERKGGPSDPLFLSSHHKRLSRTSLARLFSRWLKEAGLEGLGLSLHSCRHGCASRWLKSGLTIVQVQHLLGHQSVDVTGKYCHVSLDETAASIAAKVAPLGQPQIAPPASDAPLDWGAVLGQLDEAQASALLTLARSMVGPGSARSP